MAFVNSILGKIRGSIGDVTFSVNRGKVVAKAKVTKTTNKKTYAQSIQRAKMKPAQAVYSKLNEILNHSFDNSSPLLSMSDFMKNALSGNVIYPYLPKTYTGTAIPGAYRVTASTLPTLTKSIGTTSGTMNTINTNISGLPVGQQSTWNEILAASPMLEEGDQLTFIAFGEVSDGAGDYIWRYDRCIAGENTTIPSWIDTVTGDLVIKVPGMEKVLAACIIRTSVNSSKYEYSDEKFVLSAYWEDYFMTAEAYKEMMASYGWTTAAKYGSTLYLNQAGLQPTTGTVADAGSIKAVIVKTTNGNEVIVYGLQRNTGFYLIGHKSDDGAAFVAVNPNTGEDIKETTTDGSINVFFSNIVNNTTIFNRGTWDF